MKKISFIALFVCAFLFAQTPSEIQNKLQARYGSIQTFSANLKQTNHFSQLDRSIVYEGKIYFQPPRLLISFEEPALQRLLVYSGRAELYDGSSSTLFVSDILPEFNRMNPIELLQLYWDQSAVEILGTSGGLLRIRLSPEDDPFIREINADIAYDSGIVRKLSYQDHSQNTVSYSFSKIVFDGAIPASVWNFRYPEETQIIQQ
jgi:outer membrane lipoprotein-sorting protein